MTAERLGPCIVVVFTGDSAFLYSVIKGTVNVTRAGAHLGFSEGRGPNFRKGTNQYKTKKK